VVWKNNGSGVVGPGGSCLPPFFPSGTCSGGGSSAGARAGGGGGEPRATNVAGMGTND
jgi:hypothetical protein